MGERRLLTAQALICEGHLGRIRNGCAECYIDTLERQLSLRWLRIKPFSTRPGELCGTCDSLDSACSHPRVKCAACGHEGLEENWPFRCCNVTEEGANDE